jgi:hypothetical protein
MNIEQKYDLLRPHIKEGDIIVFHGTHLLAQIIQNCDSAYYNHMGVIIECNSALGICDANGNGVQWDRLSWRIAKYHHSGSDFDIIRPLNNREEVRQQLRILLLRSDEKWVKYDFINGVKELLNRKFESSIFKIKLNNDRAICSSNDAKYAINLGIMTDEFAKQRIQFPQDYIRYLNADKARVLKVS